MPGLDDLAEGAEWRLDAGGIAGAAFRIAVEIALTPLREMNARQHLRLVRRHVFDESVPLILQGDNAPCRKPWRLLVASRRAPADRRKQDQAINQAGMAAGEQ